MTVEFTPYSMLIDFCVVSGLLVIAQILRDKIDFLKNHYIPASMIAGFLGLFLSDQFLNILPFSGNIGSYPYLLVCVLFATLFLGNNEKVNLKQIVKNVGNTFFINMGAELMSFGIVILVGGIIIGFIYPNVFPEITILQASGFAGGHGYAAAIGGSINNLLGRNDGVIIGQTFATLGLLVGLFGGIAAINYATKKGATRLIKSISETPIEYRSGFIVENKMKKVCKETTNSIAIDTLAWHVAIVLTATGLGYFVYNLYKPYFPTIEVPMMCLTMLAGVVIQLALNKLGYGKYIDKETSGRIGSAVTDYLVSFGIASIKFSVVFNFIGPILILTIIGIIWPLTLVFFIGRKLFTNYWFERSIFIFGYITGVVAIGVTLLRIVDPEIRSGTLDDFGTAYTFQSIIELFLVSLSPIFLVQFGVIPVGIGLSLMASACFLASAKLYGVFNIPMNQKREGE